MKTILMLLLMCSTALARSDMSITWDPIPNVNGYKVRYGRTPGNYVAEEYTGYGGEPKFTFWGMYPGVYYYKVVGYLVDNSSYPPVYTDGVVLEERRVTLEQVPEIPPPEAVRIE